MSFNRLNKKHGRYQNTYKKPLTTRRNIYIEKKTFKKLEKEPKNTSILSDVFNEKKHKTVEIAVEAVNLKDTCIKKQPQTPNM